MNAFIKTLIYGLAGLCVVILVGAITALAGLRGAGVLTPERIRDFLLSPEERGYIAEMKQRAPEAPAAPHDTGLDQEKLLADLAEIAGARHASALVEELRRRKDSLDERERWLETREAEIRAARTDLARLSRQVEAKREELAAAERTTAAERARFAQLQADEASRLAIAQEAERARYGELAKLYELQKNDAWQTLRKLEPREVARILDRMDPKKAANLLKLAQQDADYPIAVQLHRELMQLQPATATEEQLKRLAQLYSFMKADQILPYLKGSEPQQIADLLSAMAQAGASDKDRAALLAAIAREDERRGRQVADLLKPASAQP
jgi:flagellar motility protein MotE (MotC chaperone)